MFQSSSRVLVKNTLLLYVRQLFTLLLALYTSRLTLQVLGETDFGVYATVGGLTGLITIITNSMSVSTQRYMTIELGRGNMDRLRQIYTSSIQIHCLLSIVFFVVAEAFGLWFIHNQMTIPIERITATIWVFHLAVVSCVVNMMIIPSNASIIAHEDMGVFALFSVLDAILKLVGVLCLFLISYDKLVSYAVLLFCISTMNQIICYAFCHKNYQEIRYNFRIDKVLLKEMSSLAGWSAILNIAGTGYIQGVNILLNIFFGPLINAAYTIAMQGYSGIRSFCSSFQLASNPQIIKLYSKGETSRMNALVLSVCKMCVFLILFLSLPFLFYANFILRIWLKDVPEHAVLFFQLLLLYAYVDVLCYPLNTVAQATGKVKIYNIVTSIFVISPLLIGYMFYKCGAIPETVTIIAIITGIGGVLARVVCLRKITLFSLYDFCTNVLLRFVCVLILSCICPIVLKYIFEERILNIAFSFIVIYIVTAAIIYTMGLDCKEKTLIGKIVSSFRNRIMNYKLTDLR